MIMKEYTVYFSGIMTVDGLTEDDATDNAYEILKACRSFEFEIEEVEES